MDLLHVMQVKCEYIDCPGQKKEQVYRSPGDIVIHPWCYIEALARGGKLDLRNDIER